MSKFSVQNPHLGLIYSSLCSNMFQNFSFSLSPMSIMKFCWYKDMRNICYKFGWGFFCFFVFVFPPEHKINTTECIENLRQLLSCLPKAHQNLLQFLSAFLLKVAAYSTVNFMTLENLAIVFGPALFKWVLSLQLPQRAQDHTSQVALCRNSVSNSQWGILWVQCLYAILWADVTGPELGNHFCSVGHWLDRTSLK